MSIDIGKTVRDIAVSMPGATRVFETLGIDYCCGGGKSLSEACLGGGKSMEDVIRALEQGVELSVGRPSEDAQFHSMAGLIAQIVETNHTYTKNALARLELLAKKVVSVHGKNHPELLKVQDILQSLKDDLLAHMLKEEQVLFPRIEQLEEAVQGGREVSPAFLDAVRNPVSVMMHEHDIAGDLLREMRSVSHNYAVPPDGCISYKALYEAFQELELDLHQHIHLENNILFPRAVSI